MQSRHKQRKGDLRFFLTDFSTRDAHFRFSPLCVFVPVHEGSSTIYLGRYTQGEFSIRFKVQRARRPPAFLKDLTGIRNYFIQQTQVSRPLINISQTYVRTSIDWIQNHLNQEWRNFSHDHEVLNGIPWGPSPSEDPIRQVEICAYWPFFDSIDVKSSDLNPELAPCWKFRVYWSDFTHPSSLPLSSALDNLLSVCVQGMDLPSLYSIIRANVNRTEKNVSEVSFGQRYTNMALDSMSNHLSTAVLAAAHGTIPSKDVILSAIEDMFSPGLKNAQHSSFLIEDSAPVESLLSSFILKLFQLDNSSIAGVNVRTVVAYWEEFVNKLRYNWENSEALPFISQNESINHNCSLLHQKIQLLGYCINYSNNAKNHYLSSDEEKDVSRFELDPVELDFDITKNDGWGDLDDIYSEFSSTQENHVNQDGQGIDHAVSLPGLFLLNTGSALKVPLTQPHAPLTSDMLVQQEEMLEKLGTSPEASVLRAQIQGSTVFCDMQAFKAANPGCVFEDFIRWYSPNDWLVENYKNSSSGTNKASLLNGHLSERMSDPNCVWRKLWEVSFFSFPRFISPFELIFITQDSSPIPASKQKPLFDHVKDAEIALDYLNSISPPEFFLQLAKISIAVSMHLFQRIVDWLSQRVGSDQHFCQEIYDSNLSRIKKLLTRIASFDLTIDFKRVFSDIHKLVADIEVVCTRMAAIEHRLPGSLRIYEAILRCGQSEELSNDERKSVLELFNAGTTANLSHSPSVTEYLAIGLGNFESSGKFKDCAGQRMYIRVSSRPRDFLLATAWGSADA